MTPFKIYYVGYQDREVIPEKIAKALEKFRSFEFCGYDIIETIDVSDGVFSDEITYKNIILPRPEEINILLVKYPLELNYFSRTNLFYNDGHEYRSAPIIYIQTSFNLLDIAKTVPVSPTAAIAGVTLVNLITANYLIRGGSYDDLFTQTLEASSFNFCADKMEVIESFKNSCLGDRAKVALRNHQFPKSEIDAIEADFRSLKPGICSSIHGWAKSNPEAFALISGVLIAAIFFMLGLSI